VRTAISPGFICFGDAIVADSRVSSAAVLS
jgi:hypothetical protein